MLDQAVTQGLRARPVTVLPVARMVIGKPVDDAAALLPRLFNLCRTAQSIAARAAFGLPAESGWREALRREILKEHILKLCVKWPGQLSLGRLRLPHNWAEGGAELRSSLFGGDGGLPDTADGFCRFLRAQGGIAPVLRAISQIFAPFVAVRSAMPVTHVLNVFDPMLQENSIAARHVNHPVLIHIERNWGRGPLWSATAVAYDLQACLDGRLPEPVLEAGHAVVPAARGLYAIAARLQNGRVASFHRITPTDHLLTPGGAMDQSLASLPADRAAALAPLLISILDPCFPVTVEPARQGEAAHA